MKVTSNKFISFFFWGLFSIPFPSVFAEPNTDPAAIDLLRTIVTAPHQSYSGHLIVTHWTGNHTKSEDVLVRYIPPNHYRWEFLNTDGSTQRVVEGDGDNEFIWTPKRGHWLHGESIKSAQKQMLAEEEFRLLLTNYSLSSVSHDDVAGRKVWTMELTPKTIGKAHQQLWIDKATGVVLENKKYRPHEKYAVESRYVRFTSPGQFENTIDNHRDPSSAEYAMEPDFLSIEDWEKATGRPFLMPPELPNGFFFESVDFFPYGKTTINHIRYTDGLTVLSVFETSQPVRSKPKRNPEFSLPETTLHEQWNHEYLTLISDTSEALLKDVAASFK